MTNPLDYTIQDADAMRYALMNDSSYQQGGSVHMAGGGKLRVMHGSTTKITPDVARSFDVTSDPAYALKRAGDKMDALNIQGPPVLNKFDVPEDKLLRMDETPYSAEQVNAMRKFWSKLPADTNMTGEQIYDLMTQNRQHYDTLMPGITKAADFAGYQRPATGTGGRDDWFRITNPEHIEMVKRMGGAVHKAEGGRVNIESGIDINREYNPFSVLEKPTYGSEVPGTTPTIDQQRYELTMKGRQEAENRRYRAQQGDDLAGVDPTGTLAVADALSTVGKSIAAFPAYVAGNAFDWLRTGKMAGAQERGKAIDEWIAPKTQEGGELLQTIGEAGPAITGSSMGFGMHPNLWAHNPPTLAQMRAGLKLGAERAAPVLGKIDQAVRSGYESGLIPQPGLSIKDVTPKVLAPANEQGFYSPTEAAALNLQRKSGNGQAFLNDILKGENVKPDEISGMGLDTFLKDKKNVTSAEVQDYITKNKIQLGERVYKPDNVKWDYDDSGNLVTTNLPDPYTISSEYGKTYITNSDGRVLNTTFGNKDEAKKYIDQLAIADDLQPSNVKFKEHSLPGGENYREVVLTLPQNKTAVFPKQAELDAVEKQLAQLKAEGNREEFGKLIGTQTELRNERTKFLHTEQYRLDQEAKKNQYRSSHWDEPNPLAHLRMSDRVTDGKKTLLVDEVQSDWHQAGRERGYALPEQERKKLDARRAELESYGLDATSAQKTEWAEIMNRLQPESQHRKVPNAPYKEDWYQLALRRAVKEAIDGGYDRVALPTGQRVNERFSLTKHVDAIRANLNPDGTYQLGVQPIGKSMQKFDESVPADKLASILGKDLANKITSDVKEVGVESGKIFSGLDLKVGGEGNKKYYDEIYPNYLKKFGKKYGAGVGKTTVDADGVAEPLHYMEITPAMRKEFSTGIHMKKGGKVSFADSLDAMRHELTKAK
jgi:hypothetical protein